MPPSRYWRFKTINKEERVQKRKKFLFWVLFTTAFLAITWWFFVSPFFKITEIVQPKNDIVANENIWQLISTNLPFKAGFNILLFSGDNLKTDLAAAFPEITDIKTKKKLFHSVIIDFVKRVPVGFWCQPKADKCYYFDKEGIIFKEAPETEGSLILKITDLNNQNAQIGNKVINDDLLNFITNFYNQISNFKKFKIIEFKIKPMTNIDLEAITNSSWSIYLDPAQNPESEANNLFTVLTEALKNQTYNLDYVDLRIPSRIFYKLK